MARPLRSFAQRAASIALAGAALLGTAAAQPSSTDLVDLFLPPTQAELDAVRADWATRDVSVQQWTLVESLVEPASGDDFDIVSHVVDGGVHYGAVRFPRNYVPGEQYPVMVLCHGAIGLGFNIVEVENFLQSMPGTCVADDFFVVLPSYRGETLRTGVNTYLSTGAQRWADRDVDDTLALLSGSLDNYPDMDRSRVSAWGISRGGAVALHCSVRDPRIRRTVDVFGFTDLSLPSVQARIDAIRNGSAPGTGIAAFTYFDVAEPYLNGVLTLAEARMDWILRSPCYFAADLPLLQVHHGGLDQSVDISHSQVLVDAIVAQGNGADVDVYYYPGGSHGLGSLTGLGPVQEAFLCAISSGVTGFCGPGGVNLLGTRAALGFQGSRSVQADDLQLEVFGARPGVGLYFAGLSQISVPAGAGTYCIGGAQRFGLTPIDSEGYAATPVPFSSVAGTALQLILLPGNRVHFQMVYRDPGNPAGSFNFSNGLSLDLLP